MKEHALRWAMTTLTLAVFVITSQVTTRLGLHAGMVVGVLVAAVSIGLLGRYDKWLRRPPCQVVLGEAGFRWRCCKCPDPAPQEGVSCYLCAHRCCADLDKAWTETRASMLGAQNLTLTLKIRELEDAKEKR